MIVVNGTDKEKAEGLRIISSGHSKKHYVKLGKFLMSGNDKKKLVFFELLTVSYFYFHFTTLPEIMTEIYIGNGEAGSNDDVSAITIFK
ncbi:TPA: hypothetical protein O7U53_003229 [Salmonella enterica]|nr:hypothetical protein [Salmonella enterica]